MGMSNTYLVTWEDKIDYMNTGSKSEAFVKIRESL